MVPAAFPYGCARVGAILISHIANAENLKIKFNDFSLQKLGVFHLGEANVLISKEQLCNIRQLQVHSHAACKGNELVSERERKKNQPLHLSGLIQFCRRRKRQMDEMNSDNLK